MWWGWWCVPLLLKPTRLLCSTSVLCTLGWAA